jgi:hypothetical protein
LESLLPVQANFEKLRCAIQIDAFLRPIVGDVKGPLLEEKRELERAAPDVRVAMR